MEELYSRPVATQPAEPAKDGWRMVPVEPTMEMIQAWNGCNSIEEGWTAMLAAASQPGE